MTHPTPSGFEPPPRQPLASIIILAYNQLTYTKQCLYSIIQQTRTAYELIIVDNASTDATDEYLISLRRQWQKSRETSQNSEFNFCQNLKIILNAENLGYAAGNNQGIALAEGEYILLLNNDIVVTPGWLKKLIDAAGKDPKIGLVGPVTNYISGPQKLASVDYETTSLEGLAEFSTQWSQERAGEIVYFWRVVGFCVLIDRAVIDRIGGLDTRYGMGNFEDDDFCIRAAIAGFKAAIARDCFIHHFGSQTFKSQSKTYRQELLLKNWEIFKQKWEIPLNISYAAEWDISAILQQSFNPTVHYHSLLGGGRPLDRSQTPLPPEEIVTPSSDIVRIDLGCGARKPAGYIGVDIYPWPGVDIVANLSDRFPFADNTVDEVRAHDFIEHLSDRIQTMNEIWRICKPNATVDIFVPSTDGRGAFQDPTHVSYWNINSFMYYGIEFPAYLQLCHSYGFQGAFSIVSLEHQESSHQVLHVRAILKALKPGSDEAFIPELNLRKINAIIVPDWNQPEKVILGELEVAIASVMQHPDRSQLTVLIESSEVPEESDIQPNLVLSTIGLNLFYRDDIDSEGEPPEISLLEDPLTPQQWQALLPKIHYRISLATENVEFSERIGINNLPIFE